MYTRGRAEWRDRYDWSPHDEHDLDSDCENIHEGRIRLVAEDGTIILDEWGDYCDDAGLDISIPDAKRIQALWNMAHDLNLSTEAIEGGIVQEMVSALKSCAVEIDTLYDIYMPEMRPKASMGQHIGTLLSKIERPG